MGFPRQEYWIRVPFPSPGELPNPEMELTSPALALYHYCHLQMSNKHIKSGPTSSIISSWKCRLQEWDTILHLLEMSKWRTLTIQSVSKFVQQQELSFVASGNAHLQVLKEDNLVVSYKTKYTLTPYLLKWFEKLCPYENLHTDACRNSICNCQTWKQICCRSISERLNIPSRKWCIIHH